MVSLLVVSLWSLSIEGLGGLSMEGSRLAWKSTTVRCSSTQTVCSAAISPAYTWHTQTRPFTHTHTHCYTHTHGQWHVTSHRRGHPRHTHLGHHGQNLQSRVGRCPIALPEQQPVAPARPQHLQGDGCAEGQPPPSVRRRAAVLLCCRRGRGGWLAEGG